MDNVWSCCLSQKYIFVLHIPFHKIVSFLNSYWKDSYIFNYTTDLTKIHKAVALMIPNWNRRRVFPRGGVGYKRLIIPSSRGRPHGHNVREVLTGTWTWKPVPLQLREGRNRLSRSQSEGASRHWKKCLFNTNNGPLIRFLESFTFQSALQPGVHYWSHLSNKLCSSRVLEGKTP